MAITILGAATHDIRFPTSHHLDGSDAMNADPDYSAAYVILETDHPKKIAGHGFGFTIGRGNEIVVTAIRALLPMIIGRTLESITGDMAGFWRHLTGDSQLRWIGPDKGAMHLATAAVVNAVWDLWAKVEGKPLWKLLVDLPPEQLVACVDFKYITDAITPNEAVSFLKEVDTTKRQREEQMLREGYPAYTTSAGWLGYSDEKIKHLCGQACSGGFTHVKVKVGRDIKDDIRRCGIISDAIGPHRKLMVDANQVWEVNQAIEQMSQLAKFQPYWIEEPTSPDDVLGHGAIARAMDKFNIGVATGEHCPNRIVFKQFMQANALKFVQIDACRLGGVNECLAVCLLARKFNLPICPHAGGVGLCEMVQHLSIWDYIACSASLDDRIIEYVDHLHEHFVHPVRLKSARYMPPAEPGYSTQIKDASRTEFEFPDGRAWRRK
jgi:L-fuconate dehydratase